GGPPALPPFPTRRSSDLFYTRDELALAMQRRSLQGDLRSLAVKQEIAGRAYQLRAIRAMAESFASGRRRGLLTMATGTGKTRMRSEEHTSELQSRENLVC